MFHHPVYSVRRRTWIDTGFRPASSGPLPWHGVDLVLNGHDHVFSATKELKKIRYVVTGGGGASLYGCDEKWFTDGCFACTTS